MTECYMIVLQGQGDTEVKFVNKETWDWISNVKIDPPDRQIDAFMESEGNEQRHFHAYETRSREDFIDELMALDSGSCLNDRALKATPDFGETFYSLKEAMDYFKDNGLEIIDEFEGYIY